MLHNPLNLKRSIEVTSSSDLDDVLKVKTALHGLGYYELPDYGMTTYPDQPLFKSIKKFQSANRLKKRWDHEARGANREYAMEKSFRRSRSFSKRGQ